VEAAVLIDKIGHAIYWHAPIDRTIASIPDSHDLWATIWKNRENLGGIAHSHPGSGKPGPSHTDLTTFAAIEAGLGKRLDWWITSKDCLIIIRWSTDEKKYSYSNVLWYKPNWLGGLRRISYRQVEHDRYSEDRK
jgi:hypothetical protein